MLKSSWARRASVVGLVCAATRIVACIEAPVLPDVGVRSDAHAVDAFAPEEVSLRAFDDAGSELALDSLSRHFEIEVSVSVREDARTYLLLPSSLDALREADLRARRISDRLEEASISLQLDVSGDHVRVMPQLYADRDSQWSFVVVTRDPSGRVIDATVWPLHVADEDDAGARVIASWPAEGTARIPVDLSEIALAFDGNVDAGDTAFRLTFQGGELRGEPLALACNELGMEGVACLRWALPSELYAETTYAFEVLRLRDRHGADVPPFTLSLRTDASPSEVPVVLPPTGCAIDEVETPFGCVLQTDATWSMALNLTGPARVAFEAFGHNSLSVAPRGDAMLSLDGLDPGMTTLGALTLTSLGTSGARLNVLVETHATMPPLMITEVCANPAGPEPEGEWVELFQRGPNVVALEGMRIADRTDAEGTVVHTDVRLAPGERALLVSDAFDADAAGVAPGVRLIRVGRSIVPSGITNRGEALYLRDATNRRLASVPAMEAFEDRCVVRREDAPLRRDGRASFDYAPCTPGR